MLIMRRGQISFMRRARLSGRWHEWKTTGVCAHYVSQTSACGRRSCGAAEIHVRAVMSKTRTEKFRAELHA